MKEYRAKVGFLITYKGKISAQKEADANEKDVFIIHVRNEDGNPMHWISTLASKF